MTLMSMHFVINLQTKLMISCEETNIINSNSTDDLRIATETIEHL